MHVFTGDVSNAGTNSNVFICVYGELGDTGERKLEKSETHMDKFERNNVRIVFFLFCIQEKNAVTWIECLQVFKKKKGTRTFPCV